VSKPLEPTEEQLRDIWSATWYTERCFCRPDPCNDCRTLATLAFAAIAPMVLEAAARELAAMPLGATRMGCIRRIHALKGTTA
jgi:hypothetical protein